MYQHLLVPVDGGDLSNRAIEASIALAKKLGASITGFVAEPLPPPPLEAATPVAMQRRVMDHDAEVTAHARAVLDRFEAQALAAGVPFTAYFDQVPRIDHAIIAAAETRGCDLIVMVTHGRGAFGEFLFGSETKAVLAGSKLPLLVLH